MYKIKYQDYSVSLNTMEDVLEKITELHNAANQSLPQMLLIDFNHLILEIGVGYSPDQVVMLFDSNDPIDDVMISFGKGSPVKNIIFHRKNCFPFKCTEYNLISLDAALVELRYIDSHHCLSNTLNWHSW